MPRKFSQRALARALNLSPARVVALKRRGMPTHSKEAAERWRSAFIGPYTKPDSHIEADADGEAAGAEASPLGVASDAMLCAALFAAMHGIERFGPVVVHLVCSIGEDADVDRAWSDPEFPQSIRDAWDDLDAAYFAMCPLGSSEA